jgi:hypothetical protein
LFNHDPQQPRTPATPAFLEGAALKQRENSARYRIHWQISRSAQFRTGEGLTSKGFECCKDKAAFKVLEVMGAGIAFHFAISRFVHASSFISSML